MAYPWKKYGMCYNSDQHRPIFYSGTCEAETMKRTIMLILLVMLPAIAAQGEEKPVSRFATEGLAGWENQYFEGVTEYQLAKENGRTVLRAHSKVSASGLIRKVKLDPNRYRYLRWSWKVAGTIPGGDERSKKGDDYAARMYVVFPGRFFWQTKAINYIWANHLPKGESIPNAYTSNAMMVAVESGNSRVGQWVTEERDILADYRRLFGGEPRGIGAIAIMTDTDNTGAEATAWYGDITISTDR